MVSHMHVLKNRLQLIMAQLDELEDTPITGLHLGTGVFRMVNPNG